MLDTFDYNNLSSIINYYAKIKYIHLDNVFKIDTLSNDEKDKTLLFICIDLTQIFSYCSSYLHEEFISKGIFNTNVIDKKEFINRIVSFLYIEFINIIAHYKHYYKTRGYKNVVYIANFNSFYKYSSTSIIKEISDSIIEKMKLIEPYIPNSILLFNDANFRKTYYNIIVRYMQNEQKKYKNEINKATHVRIHIYSSSKIDDQFCLIPYISLYNFEDVIGSYRIYKSQFKNLPIIKDYLHIFCKMFKIICSENELSNLYKKYDTLFILFKCCLIYISIFMNEPIVSLKNDIYKEKVISIKHMKKKEKIDIMCDFAKRFSNGQSKQYSENTIIEEFKKVILPYIESVYDDINVEEFITNVYQKFDIRALDTDKSCLYYDKMILKLNKTLIDNSFVKELDNYSTSYKVADLNANWLFDIS